MAEILASKISDENYAVVQGWMINQLNLKGNELLIYAIIYGFSQDGAGEFTGSLQYLADWTNSTKQGVSKNLKSLCEKGLLRKKDVFENGFKVDEKPETPEGYEEKLREFAALARKMADGNW